MLVTQNLVWLMTGLIHGILASISLNQSQPVLQSVCLQQVHIHSIQVINFCLDLRQLRVLRYDISGEMTDLPRSPLSCLVVPY